MSTRITADNGIEIEVCELGLSVIDHEDQTETWVRLTTEQRRALVDALDPDRRGAWSLQDVARLRADLANRPLGGQWTRDDLPAPSAIRCVDDDTALDMVVDHLNENHPKPVADAAEWLDRALNNPDERLVALDEARIEANIQRNRALRERDAAVARAEKAEADAKRYSDKFNRAREANRRLADQLAEARTAPAVTRDDIEKAIRGEDLFERQIDAVWALVSGSAPAVSRADVERVVHRYIDGGFDELHVSRVKSTTDAFMALLSGDDPAVFVVRESDIAAIEVESDDSGSGGMAGGLWRSGGSTVNRMRGNAALYVRLAAECEAHARRIEAEAAVDPDEAKARAEADRRYSGTSHHAFIEGALWANRHLNEQEAGDE